MPCSNAGRVLVAGHTSPSTSFTLKQLEREGCAVQSVATIAEAESSLRAMHFDIVLAGEVLPDGRGYDLAGSVMNRSATLLVSIALSETCLWLPVVQQGVRTLGKRALNWHTLQAEIIALLDEKATLAEHLAQPSAISFMPESVSHKFISGVDQRTGPQERRGPAYQAVPHKKILLRASAGAHSLSLTADGASAPAHSAEKSMGTPRDAMTQGNPAGKSEARDKEARLLVAAPSPQLDSSCNPEGSTYIKRAGRS